MAISVFVLDGNKYNIYIFALCEIFAYTAYIDHDGLFDTFYQTCSRWKIYYSSRKKIIDICEFGRMGDGPFWCKTGVKRARWNPWGIGKIRQDLKQNIRIKYI